MLGISCQSNAKKDLILSLTRPVYMRTEPVPYLLAKAQRGFTSDYIFKGFQSARLIKRFINHGRYTTQRLPSLRYR
jgi:hypothetical protein